MDCSTIRELIDVEHASEAVAAHLEQCVACRAEAGLHARLAAAVAAWPRLCAPQELAGRVMAEVRAASPARSPARRLPRLLLRPWEVGWIGAACVLLVACLSTLPGRWVAPLTDPALIALHTMRVTLVATSSSLGDVKLDLTHLMRSFHAGTAAAAGVPPAWLFAAIGFGIALVWLLARHAQIEPRQGWEDARA